MKKRESASFLKKRSKKLLVLRALAGARQRPQEQKFFGSFFQKRTSSFLSGA
jgi:hypothetical protein